MWDGTSFISRHWRSLYASRCQPLWQETLRLSLPRGFLEASLLAPLWQSVLPAWMTCSDLNTYPMFSASGEAWQYWVPCWGHCLAVMLTRIMVGAGQSGQCYGCPGFTLGLVFFCLPETSADKLLRHRAARLRKQTGNPSWRSLSEVKDRQSLSGLGRIYFLGPFELFLLNPIGLLKDEPPILQTCTANLLSSPPFSLITSPFSTDYSTFS